MSERKTAIAWPNSLLEPAEDAVRDALIHAAHYKAYPSAAVGAFVGALREAGYTITARSDADSLDAAWAEAEAALPDGWWVHTLHAWSFDDMAYRAEAVAAGHTEYVSTSKRDKPYGTLQHLAGPSVDAYGPTPTAALRALAQALRERPS